MGLSLILLIFDSVVNWLRVRFIICQVITFVKQEVPKPTEPKKHKARRKQGEQEQRYA